MSLPARAPGSTWTLAGHARRIIRPLLAILTVLIAATPVASAQPSPAERLATRQLELNRVSLQTLPLPAAPERASFTLGLDGTTVTVRMWRASLRSRGFRLLVQGADGSLRAVTPPVPATYRGTIDGRPGSFVAGTIDDGRLTAGIALADGRAFYVQPAGGPSERGGLHAVYRGDDAVAGSESCAADGEAVMVAPRDGAMRPEDAPAAIRIADIAFDADVEYFQLNGGSVESTVQDIEAVLAAVNTVYERDCSITHRISTIVVRTAEPDPYDATDGSLLLDELKGHWNSAMTGVPRDIVHLMTGKDLDGSTVGYANIGAVCNVSRSYGLSRSRYSSNFGKRATLTSHELGHNWNAVHCNREPNVSSPCNVMCSTIAGCDGMGLPNFEPQGQDAVMAFAASRSCLDSEALAVNGPAGVPGLRFEPPAPSPFRDRVTARFHMSRPGPVRLAVLDPSGRSVARLLDGNRAEGWHTVTWDGRDSRGRMVAPGVVFFRLEFDGSVVTRKVVVTR